jgi:phosphoribosyl 1,2-cyclic phosphodiesterase
MTSLTFLGTGGGRFATIYQVRATGGIYINDGGRLHLDPGPSALAGMRSLDLDPALTDCVMVSHCHPDHYGDAEMLIEGMTVEATPAVHSDPDGVGFRFDTRAGMISYVGDSEIDERLFRVHRGARVLIINLTCTTRTKIPMHMYTETAAALISDIGPEAAVLTHFGIGVFEDGVEEQARYIEKESGVRTIAAEDLMTIEVGREIVSRPAGPSPRR